MIIKDKNPFLDSRVRLEKMLGNYEKFGNLVVGVDFDFTLNDPVTKETYLDIVYLITEMMEYNFHICVWTANENPEYVQYIWKQFGLRWDFYNYSPINPKSKKPHFNILLDDSAGLNESVQLIKDIIKNLKLKKESK